MANIAPSHLLDRDLFDFANLRPTGQPDAGGDMAFDMEDPVAPTTHDENDDETPDHSSVSSVENASPVVSARAGIDSARGAPLHFMRSESIARRQD